MDRRTYMIHATCIVLNVLLLSQIAHAETEFTPAVIGGVSAGIGAFIIIALIIICCISKSLFKDSSSNNGQQVVVETDESGILQSVQVDGQRVDVSVVSIPKESRARKMMNRLSRHTQKQPGKAPVVEPNVHATDVANPVSETHFYEPLQEHYMSLQGSHEKHKPERRWKGRLSWFGRNNNKDHLNLQSARNKQEIKQHRQPRKKVETSQDKSKPQTAGQSQTKKKRLPRTTDSELYKDYSVYQNKRQDVDPSVLSSSSDKSDDSHLEYVSEFERKPPPPCQQQSTVKTERVRDAGYMNPITPPPTGQNKILNKL